MEPGHPAFLKDLEVRLVHGGKFGEEALLEYDADPRTLAGEVRPVGGTVVWEGVGGGFAFRAMRLFHHSKVMCKHEVLNVLAAVVLHRGVGGHECFGIPTPGPVVACVGFPVCIVVVVVYSVVVVALFYWCVCNEVVACVVLSWRFVIFSIAVGFLLSLCSSWLLLVVGVLVAYVAGSRVVCCRYCTEVGMVWYLWLRCWGCDVPYRGGGVASSRPRANGPLPSGLSPDGTFTLPGSSAVGGRASVQPSLCVVLPVVVWVCSLGVSAF